MQDVRLSWVGLALVVVCIVLQYQNFSTNLLYDALEPQAVPRNGLVHIRCPTQRKPPCFYRFPGPQHHLGPLRTFFYNCCMFHRVKKISSRLCSPNPMRLSARNDRLLPRVPVRVPNFEVSGVQNHANNGCFGSRDEGGICVLALLAGAGCPTPSRCVRLI